MDHIKYARDTGRSSLDFEANLCSRSLISGYVKNDFIEHHLKIIFANRPRILTRTGYKDWKIWRQKEYEPYCIFHAVWKFESVLKDIHAKMHFRSKGGRSWPQVESNLYPSRHLWWILDGDCSTVGLHFSTWSAIRWNLAHIGKLDSRQGCPLF